MTSQPTSYPRQRFPAEVISHAVWLYHVFSLSLRDVELILAERGLSSPARASDTGAASSEATSRVGCVDGGLAPVTLGTLTRCHSDQGRAALPVARRLAQLRRCPARGSARGPAPDQPLPQ